MDAKFDMYAVPPPKGDWGYDLDEMGVRYRRDTLWPFSRDVVRLAPDTEHYAWRNEYVLVGVRDGGERAEATLNLWVRKQGRGGMVVDGVHVTLFLDGIANWNGKQWECEADGMSAKLLDQLTAKSRRLCDFFRDHMRARDADPDLEAPARDVQLTIGGIE